MLIITPKGTTRTGHTQRRRQWISEHFDPCLDELKPQGGAGSYAKERCRTTVTAEGGGHKQGVSTLVLITELLQSRLKTLTIKSQSVQFVSASVKGRAGDRGAKET